MSGNVVEIAVRSKDQTRAGFASADKSASSLGAKMGKIGKVGAAGFAVVGAAALGAGKYLFDHAARLEQMGAKADTVFGKQVGVVESWSKKNAHAMGLTKMEATGLAANFGDLLIPMGFARKEAAKMSTDVVGLSGALSQWSGGTKSAAEVSEILSAAMLGETDGLKSLGIAISAADIEARLAKKGQDDLTGAARQQAEAQAIQALIFEKSTDAQKKFAEGGSPLLSAQNKLTAIFKEGRDTLAMKLIPAFAKAATFMVDDVVPAVSKVATYLGDKLGPTAERFGGFLKSELFPALKDLAGKWLEGVRGMMKNVGKSMEDNRPFINQVGVALKKVGQFIVEHVMPAMGTLYKVGFPALGKAIGIGITWTRKYASAWLFVAEHGVRSLRLLLGAVFATMGAILAAAEKGMGWIPGIGDKIKAAKKAFDSFRSNTLRNLDRTVAGLHRTRDAINGIKSKTITIGIRYNIPEAPSMIPGINKGRGVDSRARGGISGGLTMVGERGRELVRLPYGSTVIPNGTTEAMMTAGGGGGSNQPLVIQLLLDNKVIWQGQRQLYRTSRGAMGVA